MAKRGHPTQRKFEQPRIAESRNHAEANDQHRRETAKGDNHRGRIRQALKQERLLGCRVPFASFNDPLSRGQ